MIYISTINFPKAVLVSSVDPQSAVEQDELDNNSFLLPVPSNLIAEATANLVRNVLVAGGASVGMRE